MEYFDVIIVGAGPAGLKCAETLGKSKYKVLVLEKSSEIGPKVCAGGLTVKDVRYLNLPGDLTDFQYNKVKIHINNLKFNLKDKDYLVFTIDRKKLGQWQLRRLKRFKNVEVRTNSQVSKVEKDFVVVNHKKIRYKFLVGADGSSSVVRKYLRIGTGSIDIAIQYILPTKKYKEFEVFFNSKLFSTWYAWIFPHKDYVSVGCGGNPKVISSKRLVENFKVWIEKNHIDVSNVKYESFAINFDYQGHRFGNIFLAGDAGGFASGLTGEGIYQALVSGEEIGKIILNRDYKSDKIEELLRIKKKHNQLMALSIKCGGFRTLIFYITVLLLKLSRFRRKALSLLA